ncbi:MAG: hypothetical protein IJ491_08740 [Clostridia bacterium]|nr:hypothetical protein [Clostridia bacterium]
MTPYGIVYKENLYSLQESVTVWQKKIGVLKLGTVLKIDAVILSIDLVLCLLMILLKADGIYIAMLAVLGILCAAAVYIVTKNSFLKEITRVNFQNTDKQIVLFEDRIEYVTPFSKGEYFYDELVFAHEKNGIITLLIDEASLPCSICAHEVKKGNYETFSRILREKMGNRYIFEGGNA